MQVDWAGEVSRTSSEGGTSNAHPMDVQWTGGLEGQWDKPGQLGWDVQWTSLGQVDWTGHWEKPGQ